MLKFFCHGLTIFCTIKFSIFCICIRRNMVGSCICFVRNYEKSCIVQKFFSKTLAVLLKNPDKIRILWESNIKLFVEKHLRWNIVNFDDIFMEKCSKTNRKNDTITIYRTITINKTINLFEQFRFLYILNFSSYVLKSWAQSLRRCKYSIRV